MSKTSEFKQSLGLLDATMLVAGGMIGSGIFIVSSEISRNVGSSGWLLLTWLLTGIITVAAALSYGELAGMMPKAGGQYVYIREAYGPLLSFVYGWTVFMVIQTGTIAAVAVAFTKYSAVFFPILNPENVIFSFGGKIDVTVGTLLAISTIILLTYINTRGVQAGKWIQTVLTLAKLVSLFGLVVVGIGYGLGSDTLSKNLANMWDSAKFMPDGSSIPISGIALTMAIGVSMIGSLFSSDAWNNVTFIAPELKNPKRNIPLSLFWGTFIVTALYILANLSYLSVLSFQQIQTAEYDRVATAAMSVVFGGSSVFIMAALIMVSTFGCKNGLILSGARLYYAMATDGVFVKQAAELNENGVPAKALWVQCLWACLLCLSGSYNQLLNYCTFGSLLFYMVTIGGIFILRKKMPDAERPYKAFGYPIVPALYILVTLGICYTLLAEEKTRYDVGMGLLIIATGVPVYLLTKGKKG